MKEALRHANLYADALQRGDMPAAAQCVKDLQNRLGDLRQWELEHHIQVLEKVMEVFAPPDGEKPPLDLAQAGPSAEDAIAAGVVSTPLLWLTLTTTLFRFVRGAASAQNVPLPTSSL